MLKYNHYLKEIGVKETDYPFTNVEGDDRYKEDKEGFRNCEFFSLDYSLALYIYSQLCYFKDNCLIGHPAYLTEEKWNLILDTMIEGFKLYIQKDDEYSKTKQKKIKYGLRLFAKYFDDLWY